MTNLITSFNYFLSQIVKVCNEIGKIVGTMHKNGIMHGDLTTSNFIVHKKKLFLIEQLLS